MIQQQTILKVADNSGAKTVKCIKVIGGFKKKSAFVGEFVVVSVKNLRNKSKITAKVERGEIYKALIVRTKSRVINKDGSNFFFNQNYVCLINKQGKPLGSRIVGPIPKKIKKKNFSKFSNISIGVV